MYAVRGATCPASLPGGAFFRAKSALTYDADAAVGGVAANRTQVLADLFGSGGIVTSRREKLRKAKDQLMKKLLEKELITHTGPSLEEK